MGVEGVGRDEDFHVPDKVREEKGRGGGNGGRDDELCPFSSIVFWIWTKDSSHSQRIKRIWEWHSED